MLIARSGLAYTPFDVITGIPLSDEGYDNVYRYNSGPLNVRNPLLMVDGVAEEQCDGNRKTNMLCREIGDNKRYLENAVLPRPGIYDVRDELFVNMRNRWYRYPYNSHTDNIDGVYSKDNDFYTVPGGYAELRAGSTAAIQVNMPSMGLNYSTGSKADIAIYDISGRCLQTTSLPVSGNTFSADVAMPAAPAGMYLVTVSGTGLLEHFKVLKR